MLKTLALILISLSSSLFAKAIDWKDARFEIRVPENWREVKDFYGIPVTLLGPSVAPKPRVVIQIIPTDLPPATMNAKEAKNFGEKYAEGRRSWISQQDGEIYDILPGKFDRDRLIAGVSYRLNKKSYIERTHYINCKRRLYHLKIVLNVENRDELPEAESVVRSFACAD